MEQSSALTQAIDKCYDTALGIGRWETALDELAEALDARACSFVNRGSPIQRRSLPASNAYSAFLTDFIEEGWAWNDHRARRGWPSLVGGQKFLVDHDLADDDEIKRLPVYHELYMRHDLPWWATVSFIADNELWALSFLRSSERGPFENRESRRFLLISHHLSRLVRIHTRVQAADRTESALLFEQLNRGAICFDSHSRVVAVNAVAEAALGRDLYINGSRLCARDSATNANLERLIAKAAAGGPADWGAVVVQRRAGGPLIVDAFGRPHSEIAFFGAGVLLLLYEPLKSSCDRFDKIKATFGLSSAESRLAIELLRGGSLREVANRLGIAHETARTQLKVLFEKTGTNRQADLVRLLGGLA